MNSSDTPIRVLLVDDDAAFRRVVGTELARRGYAVETRASGQEALEPAVRAIRVGAQNRDLTQATARGHFREDLYDRLATFTLTIPPLRTRPEDIPCLVDHFIARFNRRFSCAKRMDDDALDVLRRHGWPGNVRELIHVIEQSVVLCDGDVIRVEDMPPSLRPEGSMPPRADGEEIPSLREMQGRHIQWVLTKVGGNRARAAQALGMSERTFYRPLERHRGGPSSRGASAAHPANRRS